MKVVLVVLALAALANAFSDREYQFAFTQWMRTHQKQYGSEEFQQRYAAFKDNMDYVHKWNAEGSETVLGLNFLADLTNDEYRKLYLGTKITVPVNTKLVETPVGDTYNITVDWRAKGAVTAIKDQGQCGSCWSFSTTGSVEGAYFLKTGKLVSLSEQNLVDCSKPQGNDGCNGGLMDQAFQYIISNKGIDTEESYPYTAKDGTSCKFNAANVGATITSYKDVAQGSETDLATNVQRQPVSVAIDASHSSFQLYSTGVYHEKACSSSQLDHGVLAVGFGVDTTSKRNFWIVKNSWGVNWGQQGYIYMSKDRSNECGIASAASYPIA